MNICNENLLLWIYNFLSNSAKEQGFDSTKFVFDFPADKQDLPLRNPVVSIGLEELKIVTSEEFTSIGINHSPYFTTIKCLICLPKAETGFCCYEILDMILASFEENLSEYKIIEMKTDKICFDSTLCGLVLPLYITFSFPNAFSAT